MLLTLLLTSASQCFAQLPLSQFKPLSDSAYLAVPEYQTGNKYQKDAILFMDMMADTHPYYIKPERRTEWFAKKAALLGQAHRYFYGETYAGGKESRKRERECRCRRSNRQVASDESAQLVLRLQVLR